MDIPNETTERILNMVCSNDKEEAIMRSILKFGFSISDIARKTKLPRTSLLYVLKKLQKRNLVRTIEDGDKIYWRACLEDVRRAFKKLDNISLTEVEVIKNVPGIINFLSSWLSLPKNSRIAAIQPDRSFRQALKKVDLNTLLKINDGIKQNKLIMEAIVHEKSVCSVIKELGKEKADKLYGSFIGRLEDYVKIPEEFADVEAEIYFVKESAYIINWRKETAIEIADKDMVALLRAMFACVKEMGVRYHQNQKMNSFLESVQKKL